MALIATKMVLKCSCATSDKSVAIFICADSMEKSESDAQPNGGKAHLSSALMMNSPISAVQRVHDEGRESHPDRRVTQVISHTSTHSTQTHTEHTGGHKYGGTGEGSSRDAGGISGSHRSVSHQRVVEADGPKSGRGCTRHGGQFHGREHPQSIYEKEKYRNQDNM